MFPAQRSAFSWQVRFNLNRGFPVRRIAYSSLLCSWIWAASLAGCTAEETSGPQLEFEVKLDESLLQFCERWKASQRPDCADFEQAAREFSDHPDLNPAIQISDLPARKRDIVNLLRFEGHFIPGKHSIQKESDPVAQARVLLHHMIQASAKRLVSLEKDFPSTDSRANNLSRTERMILASIVEKEAVSNSDYRKVASVFLNRLEKNQVLGSCPTVEYGLGYHRPFLLFKDLELQSDYNVYKRVGLPPGPVAQFSDEAYKAVLQPEQTNDIFFVYDWTTGKLHFAEEYRDHKDNAAIARANFIARYGREVMYKRFDDLYYEDLPQGEYPKGD